MKLRICEQGEQQDAVFLKLVDQEEGVAVVVVGEDGNRVDGGYLAIFHHQGTLSRYFECDPNLGFQLDADGRVVVV